MNSFSIGKKTKKSRQLSTFPLKSSIIDVRELDFRVRNGNGYYLSTMATGILLPIFFKGRMRKTACAVHASLLIRNGFFLHRRFFVFRIEYGQDNMVKPHDLLVMLG